MSEREQRLLRQMIQLARVRGDGKHDGWEYGEDELLTTLADLTDRDDARARLDDLTARIEALAAEFDEVVGFRGAATRVRALVGPDTTGEDG